MNAIEMKNVSKKYKNGFEVRNINIEIPQGSIVGFIGENGAGKTTVIKSMLNVLLPDSGNVSIFGKNIKEFESEIKEDIGVVLDDMFFPENLNVKDLNSIMKNIYKKWDSNLYNNYLEKFKINKKNKIKNLSKGMKKKLELATALSHRPKLLILDEATSGLDPVIRSEILDIFLDFIQDEENTIFFSTHITSDLDKIADEIVFIDNGKILFQESRDEILDNYGILKCSKSDIKYIDDKYILARKDSRFYTEILIKDIREASKKYDKCVIDKINLEDLMVLLIKGE